MSTFEGKRMRDFSTRRVYIPWKVGSRGRGQKCQTPRECLSKTNQLTLSSDTMRCARKNAHEMSQKALVFGETLWGHLERGKFIPKVLKETANEKQHLWPFGRKVKKAVAIFSFLQTSNNGIIIGCSQRVTWLCLVPQHFSSAHIPTMSHRNKYCLQTETPMEAQIHQVSAWPGRAGGLTQSLLFLAPATGPKAFFRVTRSGDAMTRACKTIHSDRVERSLNCGTHCSSRYSRPPACHESLWQSAEASDSFPEQCFIWFS